MRRTHNPSGTPLSMPKDAKRAAEVRALAQSLRAEPGPLLEVLHAVQADLGYIDADDVPVIADVLLLSRADVHGVVSFYEDFRTAPPATHEVRVCRGEACQSVGAEALAVQVSAAFAGRDDVAVHEVFCLGNCALGPAGQVDGRLHGRLSAARLEALSQEWAR